MVEDKRRRQEIEEKRRIGREKMEEDNQSFMYDDKNRIKSPVIPALRAADPDVRRQVPESFAAAPRSNVSI